MTDIAGNSGENSAIETLSGASKQPSELDVEGKRFGQALLADQSFIQAISTAVLSGLSMNTGTPHGSVNRPELTVTKRSAGELYGPGVMVGKSFDSTDASVQAKVKHFRPDFPSQREIDSVVIDDPHDDLIVQDESRWQASEELSAFLGTTRKPLSKFDHRQMIKEYPRPNVDAAFTPRLDSYLPGLMGGLTGPDAELREVQDKILDIMGPLGTAHDNLIEKLDAQTSAIQFSKEEVTGLMAIIQRSIQLAGHASATISQKRRVAVLSKVNKAYASLGKEDFPEAGKDLFGKGFESRLKERTETAKAISEAKKVGISFFAPTLHVVAPIWHVEGHGTMCDEASAQVVGKQGADLTSQGEGALYLSQATLQPASNHRYVTRSFTSKLCPSTSGWPPEVFSGKLEPYYR